MTPRTRSDRVKSALTTTAAAVVAIVLLLLPPASYGVVAYLNLVAEIEHEIDLRGEVINQAITSAPQLWTYQEVRLKELLSRQRPALEQSALRIIDNRGKLVTSVGETPAWPVLARESPLFDAGVVVGRLQIGHSLRGLWLNVGLLFVLGAVLAAVALIALRVIPLRALRKVNAELQRREAEIAFANTVLNAAMEGAPDGMLIVDQHDRIISSNRRFAEMWGVPLDLIEARDDPPVLRTVASRMKDPDAFAARVKYLYDHPEEQSHDRLELTDGRIFDRHTSTLHDSDRNYLGRIWFFRDMTEREALAEAVRKSEEKFRNLVEATTDLIWETDPDGRYTYASPALRGLLGYEPHEVIGKSPYDFMSPGETKRATLMFDPLVAARRPFSMLENSVLRKDGREIVIETSGIPVFDNAGSFRGYRGIDRDVTQRQLAAQALQRRDAMLHAVAVGAAELAAAQNLDESIPKAMKLINDVIQVDRISVLEAPTTPGEAPVYQYGWNSPAAPLKVDAGFFAELPLDSPSLMAWWAPLFKGQFVLTDTATAVGDVRKTLDRLAVKTALLVPITVDGKYWGLVGFDSCTTERHWEPFEIEILRTLTDLIGNAIQRERYVKELRDAMRIVQDTPTILYRLSSGPAMAVSYISQNIKLFGYDPNALTSSPHLWMSIIHPDDMPKLREALTVAVETDGHPGVIEHRMLTSQGAYRWVENRFTPIRDAHERLVEIEGILVDITERRAAEAKIARLARTDALTGLANRATFIERLRLTFASARRGAPGFAVHYLDLDRFKDINDTLGHPVGDMLLKTVADRINGCVRETDLVARPGGDEFAVLQADLGDSADAGALAAKIRAALATPILLDGNELRITASVGIAIYTPDIAAAEDMLARADLALYRAKDEGRDQYRFHSEEIDKEVREQVSVADELRTALERNEFELYYQPQVELSSGRIVGMEALLRWNHPTRGQLMPRDFISIAEKSGSMATIGKWVIDQACAQMSAWRSAGIAPPTIAANVSPVQLKTANEFFQFVTATLKKWDLTAPDLELDVTESMLAHATLAQNDVLERLQKLGIKIAIDDFGTKFSSLDYLKTYRVSRLKIPRSMVDAAARNAGNASMVRAITSIARELNIEVVAQGVETEAQWSFLTATSPAANVQGYFYSKPVPAIRAGELLLRGVIRPTTELKASAG